MKIGRFNFELENEAYIMGILNVTPDSFFDGGRFNNIDKALKQTERMIKEGASIIDIGGESTRPGHKQISDKREISRVVPVIQAIRDRFSVAISVDTYKSEVAQAAVVAGADMINDIWGFKYDNKVAEVVAKSKVAVCIMHNREKGQYNNYLQDVISDLKESIDIGKRAGVEDSQIILDPGVGFAKDTNENLKIIRNTKLLWEMGYPLLLATSRKSFIGNTLNLPVEERCIATCATTIMGYERGCRIFRVHDVKENMEALRMAQAICNS